MVSPDSTSARARRYLLDELSEEERGAIEQEYFRDDTLVDQIAQVEDELIEEYLADRLDADARQRFERGYLAAPHHRARVETVRQLMAEAEAARSARDPRVASVASAASVVPVGSVARGASAAPAIPPEGPARSGGFGSPMTRTIPLAAAAILIVGGGMWFALHRSSQETPGAIDSHPPTPVAANQRAPQQPTTRPHVLAWSLAPGGVRGGTQAENLVIPSGTDTIALTLEGDARDAHLRQPRVVIRTVAGGEVWQGAATAPSHPEAGIVARVDIPAARLRADDFIVILFDTDTSGAEHDRAHYVLRVRTPARALPQ